MIKRALHFSGKTILSCFEIMAGLLFVLAIILGVALWQFSKGPVNVSWLAPYLASAITDGNENITLRTGSIIAEWPSFRGPLSLGVSDFQLIAGTRRIVDIDSVGIRLSKAALLIGQISPEAIIIAQPTIKMIRTSKGEFIFSFLDQSAESSATQLDPITGKDIQNALFLNNNLLPNSILGVWNNLESFVFKDAQFISEDHISGVTWALDNVNLSVLRTHKSLNADISFSANDQLNTNEISKLNIVADRQKNKTTNFQIKFSSFDTSLMGRLISSLSVFSGENIVLNGSVSGLLDKDFSIVNIDGDISSSQFKDTAFAVSGKRDGNKLPLMFKLKEITLEQVASLWPEQFKDTNAAEWITRRLSKGIITNLVFTAPFQKNESDEWVLVSPRATFDYKNLSVNYREPLAPVINGFGSVVIENDTLKIKVDGGEIGSMILTTGQVNITNLTNPDPTIISIDADVNSSIANILNYIYSEPIALRTVIGIDPKLVKGTGTANVKLTVPGTKDMKIDDINVAVTGSINNILLPNIVSGMDITGGPYNVIVSDGEFRFKGQGQIAGRDATFDYKEFLDQKSAPYNFNLVARIDTDKAFRENLGIKIANFVDGVVPTDIEYKEEKDKSAIIDLSANLTKARVMVSPIAYEKLPGRAGFATAKVYLKNDQVQKIDSLNISIGNDKASGSLLFGKVGSAHDISSGVFTSVKLGEINNFALNFKQTSPNIFQFDIKGPSVDGRSFISKKEGAATASPALSSVEANISIEAEKLRGGDRADQIIRNTRIKANINKDGDLRRLDFTGIVGKNDSVSVQIKPNASGLNSLSITTKNAGAFLDAFDIYNNMRSGELNVRATQISGLGANDFRGNADIRNFKIVKAPILAKLINAFSLSGLGSLLNNEGMDFARMRAEFDWRDSKNGRVINVRNGKTSGSSIGLTFGGVLNQDKSTIDISGTVVPIAGINKIVSKIPLVGELLTGGKDGGVIAATYAVKGTPENPDVFVNPLSVLAPGFLRSILFEGGETLPKSPTPKKREMN